MIWNIFARRKDEFAGLMSNLNVLLNSESDKYDADDVFQAYQYCKVRIKEDVDRDEFRRWEKKQWPSVSLDCLRVMIALQDSEADLKAKKKVLNKAIKKKGGSNFLYFLRSKLQCDLNDQVNDLKKSTSLCPTKSLGWINLGNCYIRRKCMIPAARCFKKAICHFHMSSHAWQAHADMLRLQRRYSESMKCCVKALSLNPKCWRSLFIIAQLFVRAGKNEEALRSYTSAFNMCENDSNRAEICKNRGMIHFSMANYGEALIQFNLSLIYDETCVKALLNCCYLRYLVNKDIPKAIQDLESILERDSKQTEAYLYLGLIYASRMGDDERALHYYTIGINDVPSEALITQRAYLHRRRGDLILAQKDFRYAVQMSSAYEPAQKGLESINFHIAEHLTVCGHC